MARRRKRLVDVVRDGTFIARKDEQLLAGRDVLPWPELEAVRRDFRDSADEDGRRAVSLTLEKHLRSGEGYLGRLEEQMLRLGPRDSFEQLVNFAPWAFRHYAGPRAGERFQFDPFQLDPLREFWRRDKHGRRVYTVGCFGFPKGSGKTPLGAVLGTHALASETDAPEVYNVAGAKDQASLCKDFADANIEDGVLAAWLEPGGVIRNPETRGEYEILSSDGDLAAGVNPSAAVIDEWWLFTHRKQREAYNSQAKALHKRAGRSWLLAITTAGFDKSTQLGETYDAAVKHPRLEVRADGYLKVLRDEEAGFLFWWYGAPDDADIEDDETIRRANPAPWLDPRDLRRELLRADTSELDWRRLHLNQWTKTRDAWLPSGVWGRLRVDSRIPDGAEVFVAVDAAYKYDTTAVSWAWRAEDGRIHLRTRIWAARDDAPAHVHVRGGVINNEECAEAFIRDDLATRFYVREIVFDPRFFTAEAGHLEKAGFVIAELPQQGADMRTAEQEFYKAALNGTLAWSDDPEGYFAAHVEAVAAERTEGGWRIRKLKNTAPIDAATSAIMAHWRAQIATQPPDVDPERMFAWG